MSVSRAGLKLAQAATAFGYDFRGKVALDIGSSTGGFTEYALSRGAKRVYAVEKGTNQMVEPLKFDERIILREKTDIFDINNFPEPIDTIMADVSFVSLKDVLAHTRKFAGQNTEYLVMLKPQFEAEAKDLVKGVVKNEKLRRQIIKDFELWLKSNGFIILKKRDNSLAGKSGNLERFYLLKLAKAT